MLKSSVTYGCELGWGIKVFVGASGRRELPAMAMPARTPAGRMWSCRATFRRTFSANILAKHSVIQFVVSIHSLTVHHSLLLNSNLPARPAPRRAGSLLAVGPLARGHLHVVARCLASIDLRRAPHSSPCCAQSVVRMLQLD